MAPLGTSVEASAVGLPSPQTALAAPIGLGRDSCCAAPPRITSNRPFSEWNQVRPNTACVVTRVCAARLVAAISVPVAGGADHPTNHGGAAAKVQILFKQTAY